LIPLVKIGQKASIIVVVNEDAESIDVFEVGFFFLVPIPYALHGLLRSKHVFYSKEHRVVE